MGKVEWDKMLKSDNKIAPPGASFQTQKLHHHPTIHRDYLPRDVTPLLACQKSR